MYGFLFAAASNEILHIKSYILKCMRNFIIENNNFGTTENFNMYTLFYISKTYKQRQTEIAKKSSKY